MKEKLPNDLTLFQIFGKKIIYGVIQVGAGKCIFSDNKIKIDAYYLQIDYFDHTQLNFVFPIEIGEGKFNQYVNPVIDACDKVLEKLKKIFDDTSSFISEDLDDEKSLHKSNAIH